jgi:hypothetical protein
MSQSSEGSRLLDESRRQEILNRLQQEREMRKQFVAEGKADQFKLQPLTTIEPESHRSFQQQPEMEGMRDPSEIMTQQNSVQDMSQYSNV